jgi:uncharacterized protein (DUF1810 family)
MPLPEAPTDRFDLERFIAAQDLVYTAVLDELRRGRKQAHWIWFIFPQVEGLGHSATAHHYAIRAREEAAAYIAHPLLSARLLECTELVLSHVGKTANQIFGSPDNLKFCSSMTLFAAVSSRSIFQAALDQFYMGVQDGSTLAILAKWGP